VCRRGGFHGWENAAVRINLYQVLFIKEHALIAAYGLLYPMEKAL